MKNTELIERLVKFNLTRQEAVLYICLWENGNLTGYEASKISGISRSNVYSSLSALVEKGAAYVSEGTALVYQAVAPEEFLNNKLREYERDREYIVQGMPEKELVKSGYFTIQGHTHIKNKIYHMIKDCEKRIYFSAEADIILEYRELLQERKKCGLKIVLMSNGDFLQEGTVFYRDEPEEGQLRLITDSRYVLTGELRGQSSDTCLYSEQENLVSIMKDALRNRMRLLELKGTERIEEND
ncbi:MAG: TrmB family transcriptional regulator [Lachnospiraceae bacterium]|nr:TrmB family transcriptional regulator [Lachnospiraceae bacterium]